MYKRQPKKISPKEILFGCTGTIGEKFPLEKIKFSLKELVEKIKYTQNKLIWMKAAMGIITTDLKPKVSMAETNIGPSKIKIYGIAKGSGESAKGSAGSISTSQLEEIAKTKLPDLNCSSIESAMKVIEGTAKNMGVSIKD